MGNVQCCASDRFDKANSPDRPKGKGKKGKQRKGPSEKTNGIGGDKGDGGVHKVVIVAEEAKKRAAAAAELPQSSSTAPEPSAPQQEPPKEDPSSTETDAPRGESMAAARERFFGQVRERYFNLQPETPNKNATARSTT
ncbi:unnamed protein product, partial [Iphiclides podalirius]